MTYSNIVPAIFVKRPNRFIAICLYNEKLIDVHVKNTGRCSELLIPGAAVWLEPANSANRKTAFSLVAVQKGSRLINMDSQAPNEVAAEALYAGKLLLPGMGALTSIKREQVYGDSRFDFCVGDDHKTGYWEVKGVTLEEDGYCLFPDAPTLRGVKHLEGLIRLKEQGYEAGILFVIQMQGVRFMAPNYQTHPAFGDALKRAEKAGVCIRAFDCVVTPQGMILGSPVRVFPAGAPGQTNEDPLL